MIDALQPIAEACRITLPPRAAPVGIIGAGAIVDYAHLPAYRAAGVEVAGVYDIDPERTHDVCSRHGVAPVATVEELLGDERIVIVDVAVVPWAQPELAHRAIAAGKHLLCQKPLGPTLGQARGIVEAAEAAGRKLAVNQQLRFDEGIRAARRMVELGWLGDVSAVTFNVNIRTEWDAWPWLLESERLEVQYHSIHYLDAVRYLLGDPEIVFAATGRTAGQKPAAETRSISTLIYASGARALVHANHESMAEDNVAEFRIDGSEGTIRGTLGLLYDYPLGRPDTLEVRSAVLPTDGWLPYPVTTRWLPDAFAGPLASLQWALAEGGRPETDGRDNLGTLALVEALYRSAETGESQRL